MYDFHNKYIHVTACNTHCGMIKFHCEKSSITVLTALIVQKKFAWPNFGRVYIPTYPRRYAPAVELLLGVLRSQCSRFHGTKESTHLLIELGLGRLSVIAK